MNVNEICGYFCTEAGYPRYYAYYYTKIDNRNVMLKRCLELSTSYKKGIVKRKLIDAIDGIYDLRY